MLLLGFIVFMGKGNFVSTPQEKYKAVIFLFLPANFYVSIFRLSNTGKSAVGNRPF
jgi:hypothetical protein